LVHRSRDGQDRKNDDGRSGYELAHTNAPQRAQQHHGWPDGNIWFTETNVNQIAKINPKSGKIVEVPLPTGDSGPFGIATGPDNALWFVESKANKVARYAL